MPRYNGSIRNGYRFIVYASIGFKTSIVAVALLQFAGLTFNPVEIRFTPVRTLLYNFAWSIPASVNTILNQYSMDLKKLALHCCWLVQLEHMVSLSRYIQNYCYDLLLYLLLLLS
jgi:hypothetical protein